VPAQLLWHSLRLQEMQSKGQTSLGGSKHLGSNGHTSLPHTSQIKAEFHKKGAFFLRSMTLSKPEGEGKLHADATGAKPQASGWCVSTAPRARRTACGNEKLWVDESVSCSGCLVTTKHSNTCDFCHQLPSYLLVKPTS